MRPRPYLSFSQLTTFEQSPEKYVAQYVHGKKMGISRNIAWGKRLADALENGEADGDPLLDLVAAKLPKYERMDMPVEDPHGEEITDPNTGLTWLVPALKHQKGTIPLLAKIDTATSDFRAFREYKTSTRRWTQRMADESGQITFYATAIWIATGKIPSTIELVVAETAYDDAGRLYPTGKVTTFRTTRRMSDIIKMTLRIRRGWEGIEKLMEETLL